MKLHPLTAAHWPAVKAIYEQGIATGNATFQTDAPTWGEWDRGHLAHSRLVAVDAGYGNNGQVLGWAALSPVSGRCVYGGVAEVSVYVAGDARGRGVGRQLLAAIVAESEANGLWTLQASIFPENTTSISIHAGAGFQTVGRRERIGQLHGVWRSTVLLERRSAMVGVEASPVPDAPSYLLSSPVHATA
ncbi:phosphinothricin acetyltransferase [Hymenobacter luteus]|uniref:Phosphinothricin acetyltransferase n=2 Tax=Hymenobacter TaxID=89966 RepID=A0A7W9WEZ1_9BACT|nr:MULTISPECIES: GNAT family N-acetyltransferase [Hymenobacter]MBB4603424.1 phosphinothricin acetyltransferase [Hymenobacter latericoloratus]MBB6061222.1 phosphinothricin acetyltransferase [Hymenobacter luteus]